MLNQVIAPAREAKDREVLSPRLSECLVQPMRAFDPAAEHHIGVFSGEGVGPEVVPIALDLLDLLASSAGRSVSISTGGLIGVAAKQLHGASLSSEATQFAQAIFERDGALFCGPGGH